jgi:chloramphenicol O-acetyltransferase type A
MRYIDLETWPRREHFSVFSAWTYPHFSMCADVDLTAFYPYVKKHGISLNVATVYVLSRAANVVPEFRLRIRGGEVVEHEIVHPGTTILADEDTFTFCFFDYVEDFALFAAKAEEKIAYVQEHPSLEDPPGQDDLLFMTAIPWVSFTSFMHPLHLDPADSVPRFAWGKFFEDGEFLKMPLSAQGHHALMDGLHMGRFYAKVQEYLHHPGSVLGEAQGGEHMAREMCPACREFRTMRMSVSERTEEGREGKTKRTRTLAFHCEICHTFVRSEDQELPETGKDDGGDGERS